MKQPNITMTEEKGQEITKVTWMELKTKRLHELHIQTEQVIFSPLYKEERVNWGFGVFMGRQRTAMFRDCL